MNGFSGPIKTKEMQRVERRLGQRLEDVFNVLYRQRGLTQAQVADEIGVNAATVSRWMDDLGVEARPTGARPKDSAA